MKPVIHGMPTIIIGDSGVKVSPAVNGIVESRIAEFKRKFRGDMADALKLSSEIEDLSYNARVTKIKAFAKQHNMPVVKVHRLMDAARIELCVNKVKHIRKSDEIHQHESH